MLAFPIRPLFSGKYRADIDHDSRRLAVLAFKPDPRLLGRCKAGVDSAPCRSVQDAFCAPAD